METTQSDTDTERDTNDSSDFRNVTSYNSFQRDVASVFTSIQAMVDLPGFHDHIREEAYMSRAEDIKTELHSRKNELLNTECSVVITGETNAGKSSVINLIIGEDILPIDIIATTTRICRLRYSKKLQISTIDREDRQIHVTEFDDKEKMADKLSDLASTDDNDIKYIDVCLPVEILKGNVVIVDTLGNGDETEEKVTSVMLECMPNALAFVFVINAANPAGLQSNKLGRMLESVRESLSQKHSFDPRDAIFLLNKWETLKRNKQKSGLFEKMKRKLHSIWEDVNDDYILRFAATEVKDDEIYKREFDKFQQILKSIIAKNKSKRIKEHIGFIMPFVEDCEVVFTYKEHAARRYAIEYAKTFDNLTKELEDRKHTRQEAFENLQQNVDEFLEEKARVLHEYIYSKEFKRRILQGIEKYARIMIGNEMDSRIKKETLLWPRTNIQEMFKREVMEKIVEQYINIQKALHRIKDKMKRFNSLR